MQEDAVHNIQCSQASVAVVICLNSLILLACLCPDAHVLGSSGSGHCTVQLSVSEHRFVQVDANSFAKGLALTFVDGHGPRQLHRGLIPAQCKWQIRVFCGVATDSREIHFVAAPGTCEDHHLQEASSNIEHSDSRAIAYAQVRCIVADGHEHSSFAQAQFVWWQAAGVNGIQKLHRIVLFVGVASAYGIEAQELFICVSG